MASKALQPLLIYAVLLALSAVFISPFLWMLSTSLKHESRIFPKPGEPPQWIPTTARVDAGGRPVVVYEGREGVDLGPDEMGRHVLRIGATETPAWPGDFEVRQRIGLHWQNYADAFHKMAFWQNLRNTLFICVTVVLGTLVSCSLVAYSFARIPWPGRDTVFILVLATMMLPYQVTLIPLFAMYRELGWVGTFKPLIIPAFFGTPFYIFLLRQFFLGVPQDLSASARIDGCNEFGIYLFIMLPLSKPALATLTTFTFMGFWGSYMWPLVITVTEPLRTLPIGLRYFVGQHATNYTQLMAGSMIAVVPVLLLFIFNQRYFVEGIKLSGMGGK